MLEKIGNYISFHPEVVIRMSYGMILILLMVIGVQAANTSYYKNSAKQMRISLIVSNELVAEANSKLKVLETAYYGLEKDFSIYENDIATVYSKNLATLKRVEGQRKNVIFINYLSYIKLDRDYVKLIAGAFYDAALKYDIDSRELIATAWHESRFNSKARSHVGATGVMQVMELWLKNDNFIFENDVYCKQDLLDPVKNIQAGAYIYNHYKTYWRGRGYKKDHNVRRLALLSYNRGRGRVSSLMRNGIDPANGYFKVIKRKYNKLIKLEKTMI